MFDQLYIKFGRVGRWFCIYLVPRPPTNRIIQSNFNGSNTFGTMKIYSRQGQFELMSVNHIARSGGIIGISFRFSSTRKVCRVFPLESPRRGDSNEYIQYTISQFENDNHLTLS